MRNTLLDGILARAYKLFLSLMLLTCTMQVTAQTETAIVVASYNLRMHTERDSANAWPHRKEMVKALIRFHDFDIVGTQEGFRSQLEDLGELTDYRYVGVGRDDGKQAGEHCAIFYKKDRFYYMESGDFWLSETPDKPSKGWDATCCNRIVSWAKLVDKATEKTFYVFNAHFDHQGVLARRGSATLLVQQIKAIAGAAPVVLTGDFNSLPETPQMKEISGLLEDTFRVSRTPPYGPVGTANGFQLNAPLEHRIDYIFVSPGISVLKYGVLTDHRDRRYPSDHLPVMAKIRIP